MCLAVPGRVIDIELESGMSIGTIDFRGAIGKACLDYVPDVKAGQYVVVHAGFALSVIDEKEALLSLQLIDELETAATDTASGV